MARAIYSDEFDSNLRRQKDVDQAWLADLALIRELTREERQAEDDRIFAARLAGIEIDLEPDDRRSLAMLLDDRDDESDDEDQSTVDNTSASQLKNTTKTPSKRKKCAACLEPVNKNEPCAPCGHPYHVICLKGLFMAAIQDESLMPPRCCGQKIPVDLPRLTVAERKTFDEKHLENSTNDRLYCSKPSCSAFIPPTLIINSVGTCPKLGCGVRTCSMCKTASHENLDCPKDTATAAVLATALEAGWARCYQCRALVELAHGCYHMTCRCRAEFCYLCAVPWKKCSCPQWDEQRLYREARVRTARIHDHQAPQADNGRNFNRQVRHIMNQLRENEECRHTGKWLYTRGGGRCEECHNYLPQYLFRCSGCQLMACNRCRRNRL